MRRKPRPILEMPEVAVVLSATGRRMCSRIIVVVEPFPILADHPLILFTLVDRRLPGNRLSLDTVST